VALESMDADKSGSVSYEEFTIGYHTFQAEKLQSCGLVMNDIKTLWNTLNADKDGCCYPQPHRTVTRTVTPPLPAGTWRWRNSG